LGREMDMRLRLGNVVYLLAGVVIGLSAGLFILKGATDLSLVFAALGVLLLVGQVGVAYRQASAEEAARRDSRAHELRVRNEDLFAAHSRDLAKLSITPLVDATIGDSPNCDLLVKIPDRPTSAASPVAALWNWESGRRHLIAEPDVGPTWVRIETAMASYLKASGEWESTFRAKLEGLLDSVIGPGFVPWNSLVAPPPSKGYVPDQFRWNVRSGLKGGAPSNLREIEVVQGVRGVSTGGGTPLVATSSGEPVDVQKVSQILTTLSTDPELRSALAVEEDAMEIAKSVIDISRYKLRVYAARVELSGRVSGDCDVCRQLIPRISRDSLTTSED
jgi:hypothetical protein